MKFIKNLLAKFSAAFADEDIQAYTFEYGKPYTVTLPYAPTDKYFTQAEQQYLKLILADRINEQEFVRKSLLETAKHYQHHDKLYSKFCFKHHRQLKVEMKKLVAIQTKLKHTLETRG